jgi:cell pole-organizing protein PopZ
MNAADTFSQTSAAADQRAYEPSMEEILASIRRIIADDQSLPNRAFVRDGEATLRAALDSPEGAPMVAAAELREFVGPVPDTTVMTEHQLRETVSAPSMLRFGASGLGHVAVPQYAMPDSPIAPNNEHRYDEAGALASQHSADELPDDDRGDNQPSPSVHEDLAIPAAAPALTHQGLDEATVEPAPGSTSSLFSTATDQTVAAAFNALAATRLVENDDALKDMVRTMVRPMLKSWLDDNLPNLVERLVRAEIERVARGGR